jgi:hypothetical protein
MGSDLQHPLIFPRLAAMPQTRGVMIQEGRAAGRRASDTACASDIARPSALVRGASADGTPHAGALNRQLTPSERSVGGDRSSGLAARLYVGDATQPALVVNDLKLGTEGGGVALWIGPGTEGSSPTFASTRRVEYLDR